MLKKTLLLLCLGFNAYADFTEDWQIYTQASHLSYSEASAVYQMYRAHWHDYPSSKGNQAFTRNRFILGAKKDWFSIDYVRRNDVVVHFSPDSAKIFYYQGQDKPLPNGQQFDVYFNAQQLSAEAARFGLHSPKWLGMEAGIYINYLWGNKFQEGEINGNVSQDSKHDYNALGQIDYRYSRDLILHHELPGPTGQGYALDMYLRWQYQNWRAKLLIEDIKQRMHWSNTGHIQGEIKTKNQSYNEAGFAHYDALFSGYRGVDSYTAKALPSYYQAELSYQWQAFSPSVKVWSYNKKTFPQIGSGYQHSSHYYQFLYECNSEKVTFSYQWQAPKWQLGMLFGSSDINPKYAHALEAQFNLLRFF